MDPGRLVEGFAVAAPGVATPLAVRVVRRFLVPVTRLLHRPMLEGVEHLPRGPFLLVANHSGCMGLAEINSFIACWVERFGGERPIAGYAHPISFTAWPLTWFMKQIGGIPSTYAAAWAFCASRAR